MKLHYTLSWPKLVRLVFVLLLLTGCNPASDNVSPDSSLDQARLRTRSPSNCVALQLPLTLQTSCGNINAPVCGCNKVTYQNACLAQAAGIRVEYSGNCKEDCVENPLLPLTNCSFNSAPVCGCNNVTYLNACFAQAVGIRVVYSGSCRQ
ncbi:Kazal-type serine protease inhibitor family protein [Spirosoma migulaei]